ncbi:hypothetical protein HNP46_006350 [Pseudomonas nitritireducens]|uniref:Uncharacterized protein n=1 Tax=Pseudomonas nitroreducens TaxID=46680 RepID=A0A7W7KRB6_PSENT|nr:hypothetical protein [Pseudomonas nitritireducens]MBB4867437.1 hypothetical protein [Pseudomonas nitritireducens]
MSKPFLFATDTHRLSRKENGDEIVHTLLLNSQRVSPEELSDLCDLEDLLEGAPLDEHLMDDETSGCYRCDLGGHVVYFIQSKGHEDLFTEGGLEPTYFEPIPSVAIHIARDALARVLLPANTAMARGTFGIEGGSEMIADDLEYTWGPFPRFRLFRDGEAVCGLSTESGRVHMVYSAIRGQGLATELFDRAKAFLGDLEHSSQLTDDGKAFVAALTRRDEGFEP